MKKIVIYLMVLSMVIAFSCQKDEKPQLDLGCVQIEKWQIYDNQILNIYKNAPLGEVKTNTGKIKEMRVAEVTPELVKLFELRNSAYNEYLNSPQIMSGKVVALSVTKVCWWCECSKCHWQGNTYTCVDSPSWNPCTGWNCPYHGCCPLITKTCLCIGETTCEKDL